MPTQSKKNGLTLESLVESMVLDPLSAVSGEGAYNPLQLIAMINQGMLGSCLLSLQKRIPPDLLSRLVGGCESDLSGFSSSRLNYLQTDNIYDTALLWYELREFFSDDDSLMREWILDSNPALSGECPKNVMATIVGRQLIRKCIGLMQSGDFS